jgi:hypothetical protein
MRGVRAILLALLCLGLAGPGGAAEQKLQSFEQAAHGFFPESERLVPEDLRLTAKQQDDLEALLKGYPAKGWRFHWQESYPLVRAEGPKGKLQGFALQIEEIGKHRLISFAVAVHPDGDLAGLAVLTYRENYGLQIKEAKFLRQYQGKRWSDKIESPGDIDAVSGATYSSYASNRAVRKALAVLKLLKKIPD